MTKLENPQRLNYCTSFLMQPELIRFKENKLKFKTNNKYLKFFSELRVFFFEN